MAFPLAAVGLGINLLSGISGLFGAAGERKRAEEAQAAAIRDLEASGNQDYSAALGGGQRDLYGLQGNLNAALESGGRSLGAAQAGAGVYNSSAVSGALANQAAANASTVGRFSGGLADTLARIRARMAEGAARLKFGAATNDVNFAREQQAGTAGGISSMLAGMGQMNLANQGANAFKPNNTGSVLAPPVDPSMRIGGGTQFMGNKLAVPSFNFGGG